MNEGEVLVVGGTSDARALCRQLDAANVAYTLSVATPAGKALAGDRAELFPDIPPPRRMLW